MTDTRINLAWSLLIMMPLLVISSCGDAGRRDAYLGQPDSTEVPENNPGGPNDHLLMATLFQQRSAEYDALCYQAFNTARLLMMEDLADQEVDAPRAIITDIDETVLDNSPYEAFCILNGTDYPLGWDEWCNLSSAEAVPGALEFLQLAEGYGIDVFYVTNRKDHLREVTLRNLKALGFPNADDEHLLMRTESSDKEARRQGIMDHFHVTLMLGDNLADFTNDFYQKSMAERGRATEEEARLFGRKFIVLPNPMYGEWESALYNGSFPKTDSAQMVQLKNLLISPDDVSGGSANSD